MENKITIFNPIGKFNDIYKLQELSFNIQKAIDITGVEVNSKTINDELNKRVDEWWNKYSEIIKYLSNFWGKYVHIKFSYNSNYNEDRETNPIWTCDYEVNGLLYRFIPENNCLFGVFNRLNNPYYTFLKDDSINLSHYVETDRMEINEISEEDFLKQAQEENFKVLKNRLDKIESGNYELTENGYQSNKAEIKIN
jgi:hypothetical protein